MLKLIEMAATHPGVVRGLTSLQPISSLGEAVAAAFKFVGNATNKGRAGEFGAALVNTVI